jgi:two-component system, chemotaxis family, protein-glutamate methylesterase/glutaminase
MEDIPEGGRMSKGGTSRRVEVVLIGASAGGMHALSRLLPMLPGDFPCPVVIVQHLHPDQDLFMAEYFDRLCALTVKEAEEKEPLVPGFCYLAPPDYHLLIERDGTLSLSTEEKVNHSRPSIDVLLESAAVAFGAGAMAVMLTGASRDGAAGLAAVRSNGGLAVVQDPATAEYPLMPQAALDAAGADHVLPIEGIGELLRQMTKRLAQANDKAGDR